MGEEDFTGVFDLSGDGGEGSSSGVLDSSSERLEGGKRGRLHIHCPQDGI